MKELKALYIFWESIGAGLRALSLSGNMGNALAFFLYVLISLLPVLSLGVWIRKGKRKFYGTDILPVLLSAYTFYLLYAFINPGLFGRQLPKGLGGDISMSYVKAIYGGLWLSIIASWLLMTWIRSLNSREVLDRKKFLYQGMGMLLTAAMIILTLGLIRTTGIELWERLIKLRDNAGKTGGDIVFTFLGEGSRLIPSGFLIAILYQIKRLFQAMDREPYGESGVRQAERLAGISRMAVTASVLCNLIWNGALFFCAGSLTSIDYRWEFSLFPLLAAFGSLIMARYLREAGELHRDNEMII